jgi:hypothetical protein
MLSLIWALGTVASGALAADWVRKVATSEWTWFEDYAFAWATYVVACEPARSCQVGMGVFAFGAPRGEKISFTGEREILVVGIGALHIRAADGRGPVKAAVAPKKVGLIKISWDF